MNAKKIFFRERTLFSLHHDSPVFRGVFPKRFACPGHGNHVDMN